MNRAPLLLAAEMTTLNSAVNHIDRLVVAPLGVEFSVSSSLSSSFASLSTSAATSRDKKKIAGYNQMKGLL